MSDDLRVDDLVDRWEYLRGLGQPVSAETLCADYPDLLTDVRQRVRALEAMNRVLDLDDAGLASTIRPTGEPNRVVTGPGAGARYRPLRLHARGGLGEVFMAQDEELNREVALKRVQAPYANRAESCRRFLMEAEVTGRLEHPGVVPVYGLGQDADGRPVYAMRFVRGGTLQESIQRFHDTDRPGRDPDERAAGLRELLGRFRAVCQTVGFAHSRGMLHRDLKPANIMLGDYGETLVMDWGLARPIGQPTGTEPALPGESNMPADGSGTRTGDVIGTPAYMSPEQAGGVASQLGPASDIYGLGATLYAILTARAPFDGSHIQEVVDRAVQGSFPPPRQVRPGVSRPLEAICLKAMARRPEDRYATALCVGDDVDRWIAGEPVSAWREPWAIRARRWLGRHRTLVTTGAVAGLVALVSLVASTVLLAAANDRERLARSRAEENLRTAREAVDRYYTTVSEDELLKEPGMQLLRQKLLDAALEYYQAFLEQQSHDSGLRAELAQAYFRVGRIHEFLNHDERSNEALRQARDLQQQLLDENPNDTKLRIDLAVTIWIQGFASHKTGRLTEALTRWEEARGLAERAVDAEPGNHRGVGTLAMVLNDLGGVLLRQDRIDEAGDYFAEAVRRFDAALALAPTEDEYRRGQGLALVNTAIVVHRRGRPADAVRAMQEPLTIFSDLGRRYRGYFKYQNELASVQTRIGGWRLGLNQRKEGLEALHAAWDLREEIASKNAHAPGVWTDLTSIANEVGRAQWQGGNVSEAVRAFRRACEAGQRTMEMDGSNPASRHRLAADLLNLSAAHFGARQPKEALDATDRAIKLWEELIKGESAANLENLYHFAGALNNRGLALNDLKRYEEALPTFDEAARRFREILDKSGPKEARWQLSSVYHGMASAHRGLGRPADAAKAARECRKNLPDDPNDLFDVARQFAMCADFVGKGKPDLTADEREERRTYVNEALDALRDAVKSGFKDAGQLETDVKLDPLRGRDEFQALVKELKGRTTPKKGPLHAEEDREF